MARADGRSVPIHDVVRGLEEGIDTPAQWSVDAVGVGRQLEVEGLPIRIEDDMKAHARRRQLRREGEAVRGRAPVRPVELDAVPSDVGSPNDLVQSQLL